MRRPTARPYVFLRFPVACCLSGLLPVAFLLRRFSSASVSAFISVLISFPYIHIIFLSYLHIISCFHLLFSSSPCFLSFCFLLFYRPSPFIVSYLSLLSLAEMSPCISSCQKLSSPFFFIISLLAFLPVSLLSLLSYSSPHLLIIAFLPLP